MSSRTQQWRDVLGDHAVVPVPEGEQRTWLNVSLVYTGVLAVVAVIAIGTSMGINYGLRELIIIAIVGSIILAFIGGLTAFIGGTTGLSTYIILRYPFGYVGSWIWGLAASGIPSGIGWFSVQTWLFGVTVAAIAPVDSMFFDVGVAAIWGGFLMMVTAIYGYKGLSFLSYLAVPMFILVAIAGFMIGFDATANIGELFAIDPPEPGVAVSAGITAVVGSYIVGATITADVGRFARKRHYPAVGWVVHVLVLMPLLLIGAAIMTLTTGELDFAQAMLASGMGLGVFIMVIFGFWTTNDNNLYSGALAWSVFLPLEKRLIVALQAVVGIAIASYVGFSAGVSMAPLISFLEILGITVPAIAGVIIADFYLYRWWAEGSLEERYEYDVGQEFGLFVWPGWVAALVGIGVGGVLLEGVFIGSLNVLLIAGVLHVVLMVATDVLGLPSAIGRTRIDETGRSPEVLEAMPGGGHLKEDRP